MVETSPQETFHTEIPQNQKMAILYSVRVGLKFKTEFPWIEDLFRSGNSIKKIAKIEEIRERYPGSNRTIERGLAYSLRGYNGEVQTSRVQPYPGLIPQEEYNAVVVFIQAQTARDVYIDMKKQKRGLVAITSEERKKIGRKSGLKLSEKGLGINAQTYEERRASSRLAVIERGRTPWEDAELAFVYERSQDSKYHINNRLNIKKLVDAVNGEFHKGKLVRKNRSIPKAIKRWETHLKRIAG